MSSSNPRKSFTSVRLVSGTFLSLILASLAWGTAFSQSVRPIKPIQVETQWPGILANVYQIVRLPDNRVSLKLFYQVEHNAPNYTGIADRPVALKFDSVSKAPQIPSEGYGAYSLKKAGQLIDESTDQIFHSAEAKPGDIFHPGETTFLEIVSPGGSFFVGEIFACPPTDEKSTAKQSQVTFNLPGLKHPLKNVPLPREVNVPLDFFSPPQSMPFGTPLPPPASN